MVHKRAGWRLMLRRAACVVAAAALQITCLDGSTVWAQSIMRSPNINVGARAPSINNIGPGNVARINPNLGNSAVDGATRLRTSGGCSAEARDSDRGCSDKPSSTSDGGTNGTSGKTKTGNSRRNVLPALATSAVPGQFVAEIDGALSDAQADELARRHRLVRLESRTFGLIGATLSLFRITDRRTVAAVSRELASESGIRTVQPNFRYILQEQNASPIEGDPAQYALAKLRLPQAHVLARGDNVTVAVIDSGIDARHPELAGSIADSFDALNSKEGPHLHGTGIAGAIVAHARLMGAAPAARILAIRAFGAAQSGAESTSFVVLKGLDYAVLHGAQIINMSFAGPKDALIERGIAATAARGVVMVAASGNAGPKSPPLFPAANPNVIAVSATDAQDKLFAASNRGNYIAVAAPGADIFLPAPDDKYQMTSGTSFSAAYVSGLVALVLERNPALKPEQVRAVLTRTARDLGAPGRDDLFGAGEADAFAAVTAAATAVAPVTAAAEPTKSDPTLERRSAPVMPSTRALDQVPAAMAADKSDAGIAKRPAMQ
jgi:Subtilase family